MVDTGGFSLSHVNIWWICGYVLLILTYSLVSWRWGNRSSNSVSELSNSRVGCLSHFGLSKNAAGATENYWVKGRVNDTAGPIMSENFEWIYQNPSCPLDPFSLSSWCTSALGCEKNVLFVGDSTMESLMDFWIKHLPNTLKEYKCPTPNGCTKKSQRRFVGKAKSRGCVLVGGHMSKVDRILIHTIILSYLLFIHSLD